MRFEIQYKKLNQVVNNVDCDIEYVMKVLELQYKGLVQTISLKGDGKSIDFENVLTKLKWQRKCLNFKF